MGPSTLPAAGLTRPSVGRARRFWDSTVGKKTVMALTGMAGIGFVVVHMVGNLQMFMPSGAAQAMHDYAVGLRQLGPLLWIARIGLLVAVVLHVTVALQLIGRNRAARPVAYARRQSQVSTLAARTMRVGGLLLFAFIVFHIMDMTFGVWHPQFLHLDPYNNLRLGFERWWAVAFYVVAVVFLGLHLYHGAWASWRTIGARRPGDRPLHRSVAVALAVIVTLGMAAIPIAAAMGMFKEDAISAPTQRVAAPVPPSIRPSGHPSGTGVGR
ncbi:MAG: succinate dehydrogenase cytochrome b subunit [Gemmatimonadaceae bacterium]